MGSGNTVPSGEMGLGQPPEPESKPLRLRISFFIFTSASSFRVRVRVAPTYAGIHGSGFVAGLREQHERRKRHGDDAWVVDGRPVRPRDE